jgi:hypothetical protein
LVFIRSVDGDTEVTVHLTANESRRLATALKEAASFADVQTTGEQNAEELARPPALNAAKPRTCRVCQKPIDDNIANHPFLCGTCLRELKS